MVTISSQQFLQGGKPTLVQSGGNAPIPELKKGSSIGKAFKSGINQVDQAMTKGKKAKNPLELLESGAGIASGAINTALSPLAPVIEPTIGAGINYLADKISNNKGIQDFAQTSIGQGVARGAEDIGNVDNIAGTIAGGMGGTKVVRTGAKAVGKAAKPITAGTGRVLKNAGEGAYGVTVTASEQTNRALSSYKESSSGLMDRIKSTVKGEEKGKPVTEANTAARYGLMGTEAEIGVQAGRHMKEIWQKKIEPALKNSKAKMDMRKLTSAIEKKIIKENPELGRRNDLLKQLENFKSDYKNVSGVGLPKAQTYKEGWTKFLSEQSWKGKPISSTAKEIRMMAGDLTRDFIRKNTDVGQEYIDYGNLKSVREAGIKSGIGDPAKKSISRGAWQFIMDKAVTPIATVSGKILYRTGEGLEFLGEPNAKTVGDIIGNNTLNGVKEVHD